VVTTEVQKGVINMKSYRQGDVLLVQIKSIPQSATPKAKTGRIVLAEGEATGHAHTIDDRDATELISEAERIINVTKSTPLTHQEHATIVIDPGVYKIVRQREYTPEGLRNVAD
jgi:hypothetical protein